MIDVPLSEQWRSAVTESGGAQIFKLKSKKKNYNNKTKQTKKRLHRCLIK